MLFRNLTLFRFPASLDLSDLESRLAECALKPVGPLEVSSRGFVPPFGQHGEALVHAIGESLRYCELVLRHRPQQPQLTLRRGRLLHEQGDLEGATRAYAEARALGLPATRILPYQAEAAFERRDFEQARQLVRELGQWDALPRLRPVIDYWSGTR